METINLQWGAEGCSKAINIDKGKGREVEVLVTVSLPHGCVLRCTLISPGEGSPGSLLQ